MSKRQTRSDTRAAKRAADYNDWQNTVMFVMQLVVLNGYVEIAKPCVALCRETWALPAGVSDEEAILMRKDNAFWPHIINKKKNKDYLTDHGYTRLHWAARAGYTNRVADLIKWGANIEETADSGTPLMVAAWYNNAETVRELLKLGANVDYGYNFGIGRTVLLKSCKYNSVDIVKELLAAGADVEKTDLNGDFPLFDAAINKRKTLYKMLLDAGADEHRIHERYNQTPMEVASGQGF